MGIAAGPFDDVVLSSDEFVEAWAAHERAAACLALAARRLEVCGEWAGDGSVSMAAWLRHRCRMSNRDATALVHRGRFLDTFGDIAEAACTGVLSAGQITALKASCPTGVEPVMRVQQAELVTIVAPLSVADAERAAQVGRRRAEALVELPEPVERPGADHGPHWRRVGRQVRARQCRCVAVRAGDPHCLDVGRQQRQPFESASFG